jgi:C4-dicarboxylate-specific signal transduction histidine kinase
LPQITQRLQQTLEKLQAPQVEAAGIGGSVLARAWWEVLQQRYAHDRIEFSPVVLDPAARVPAVLYDSVADNLLHNVLLKRQSESGLAVCVALAADAAALSVCDSGNAVSADVAAQLLQSPVSSENGFGIGLYHAARQAEGLGYELRLASNERGKVCFELRRVAANAEAGAD